MIDPSKDELITLAQAARRLPGTPSPATLWRWHRKGFRGIRLETVVVGGKRYTTQESFAEFVRAMTEAADGAYEEQREERDERTERRLAEAGLID